MSEKIPWSKSNYILQKEYEEISARCREFTVALLDECRASKEVRLLLEADNQAHETYPRLSQAIDMGIKEVIRH